MWSHVTEAAVIVGVKGLLAVASLTCAKRLDFHERFSELQNRTAAPKCRWHCARHIASLEGRNQLARGCVTSIRQSRWPNQHVKIIDHFPARPATAGSRSAVVRLKSRLRPLITVEITVKISLICRRSRSWKQPPKISAFVRERFAYHLCALRSRLPARRLLYSRPQSATKIRPLKYLATTGSTHALSDDGTIENGDFVWTVPPAAEGVSWRRTALHSTIGGRALDILVALAERPGEVVSKRDLVERVWADVQCRRGQSSFPYHRVAQGPRRRCGWRALHRQRSWPGLLLLPAPAAPSRTRARGRWPS